MLFDFIVFLFCLKLKLFLCSGDWLSELSPVFSLRLFVLLSPIFILFAINLFLKLVWVSFASIKVFLCLYFFLIVGSYFESSSDL